MSTTRTEATKAKTAAPPTGTEVGSHHLLTYSGALVPTEYVWSGTGWQSLPGGYGTKVHGMTVLGWCYVSPCTVTTPPMRETLLKAAKSYRDKATWYLEAAEKMEARIHG